MNILYVTTFFDNLEVLQQLQELRFGEWFHSKWTFS